ncbi:MAG: DNA repair and recombination protein RadA [Candidatus Heimdallarchaeaceae archaeon]
MFIVEQTTMIQLEGIEKELLKKLEQKDYSLGQLSLMSEKELAEDLEIEEELAALIIQKAQEQLGIHPYTAAEFLEIERRRGRITTGSEEFDSMLNGGIWTGEITELVGSFSSGKTQLCFQLCINVQLPKDLGGLEGKAFFIDTERTFSPQRIEEIASFRIKNTKKVLDNILVAPTSNTDIMLAYINQLEKIIPEENIKLVIIDSLAAHFRAEFIGKDRLVERQQKIMNLAEKLVEIAVDHDVAIVVTNQIIAAIDQFLYGSGEEPALGFAWAHRPQQRIFLRKSRGSARIARLFDSSRFPDREILFYVTEQGISDTSPASLEFY